MSELSERIEGLDWEALRESLDERGHAVTQQVLTSRDVRRPGRALRRRARYRSVIDMRRYRFGSGVYKYFDRPLPAPVQQLREALYEPLARVGNEWAERVHGATSYPATLDEFLDESHERGQNARRR